MKSCFKAYILLVSMTCTAEDFIPAPSNEVLNNPHRGFMLWGSNVLADGGLPDNFHGASIYHVYLPWRMVESSDQVFEWDLIEQTYLEPISDIDPQATFVMRLVADYPDGPGSGIDNHYSGGDINRDYPLFLEQTPLNIGRRVYTDCDGDGPGIAPDWNDPEFISQANQLILAFGLHFDGDPRITAVQVGLLGLWGEWHQSGCDTLAPHDTVKNSLKDTYDLAFNITPLQTRYARNPDVTNVTFGFHEDYFPSFTAQCIYGFPLCNDSGDWNLEYGLTHVVPAARNNWQDNPISGESPLTSQKNAWVSDEADITTIINDYHFSFLGPAGKHEESGNSSVMNRLANQLGYRIQINQMTIKTPITTPLTTVSVTIANVGSAPIYHPYQLALDWVNAANQTVTTWIFDQPMSEYMPKLSTTIDQNFFQTLPNGSYSIRAYGRPLNPNAQPLTLANSNKDVLNRVIIGEVQVSIVDLIFADDFETIGND
ncbi:MAG: DUF4832 domain-containing protein [Marinicella sp.]|nr:DUF4832 domain-containing protein [Xanthomonadales bacterium]